MSNDLPEGYDPEKIPAARYRLRKSANGTAEFLSGYSYVPVVLKGETEAGKVIIKSAKRCDHGTNICASTEKRDGMTCTESWQIDYTILWHRTAGGRKLISALGVDADKHHNPSHPANRFNKNLEGA